MTHDSLISPPASSISPAVSMTKSDSSVSCYNDYLVHVPSNDRSLEEESSIKSFSLQNGDIGSDVVENNLVEISDVDARHAVGKSEYAETAFIQRGEYNEPEASDSSNNDSQIWFPPEAEDQEDDIEGSVANYEDDDEKEYGDGMNWRKPSNLSNLGQDGSGRFRFRVEMRKEMNEVMNGKLKALVENLLKSMGISCSGNDGDTWVDTVMALSWEAASFLKPDAFEGKAMDPDGYVKVKCIATGTRSQSEVFKGLVFKKHAAHKHMLVKCKKPKLLLIKGALSGSCDGLSSFESMKQENDRLDYLVEMIEKFNPNVVLVEKTVSRDIQESFLAKGMTLVLEMKQHRLERVARCTGSPILSSDKLNDQKLKRCESFYFEKIVEEHAALCESGNKPKKTLMFLEGCPTRMGFTILLKGSHSNELKKIKCVVQFAVVMAYHLILESSFLLNQRVMFSTTAPYGMTMLSNCNEEIISSISSQPLYGVDDANVPISSSFHENRSDNLGLEGYTLSSYEPSGLSSLSASLQKVVGFPLFDTNHQREDSSPPEAVDTAGVEDNISFDEADALDSDQFHLLSTFRTSSLETKNTEDHMQRKDDISAVLDSESILVLKSRRNVTRGIICKQSCFSCIKFYRNFDVPLGKFLQDNLLNQKLFCGTCNELPAAHLYYYAHHNKQLTIQVKHLPLNKHLPGGNEGKLWMWSCFGQCKPCKRSIKSTKRVLVSIAARGLSFGKFLELGFSNHSSWEIPSTCGHSFHGDYFHLFGLGSMVAMFRYSTVATYSVSLPRWKVEFSDSVGGDFLKEEIEDVYREGHALFAEVENSLSKLESEFAGSVLNLQGSCKRFTDFKEMLKQEQDQFQVDMKNLITSTTDASGSKWLYKPLYLNHIQWELLLHSYIWDERLYSLISPDLRVVDPHESEKKQSCFEEKDTTEVEPEGLCVPDNIADSKTDTTEERNSLPFKVLTTEPSNKDVLATPASSQFEIGQENSDITQVGTELSSSASSKLADPKGWMWTPFSQIQSIYLNDLHRGYLPKYEPTGSYTAGSSVYKMITEEGSRLHFPLGATGNHIVSDYEDQLSSMIACALAFLKDRKISSEDLNEKMSSHCSSFSSMDSDGSSFGEESCFSRSDGLELLDSVASSRYIHPVISMGRLANKTKYSIACLFAKDFLDLRSLCGLSEVDYIASLDRCEQWDAKGGKSKSSFSKTLDDRFVIKEINKTEFCSFLEFASDYFGYMNQCFKLGNQTCLAKILGIYQVKTRKSGTKHDVMVMENVTYCRKITRQYDLKGSLYARFNDVVDGAGDVLLDQNFVNDMNVSPLYVNTKAKQKLQRAVWNDTAFLNRSR